MLVGSFTREVNPLLKWRWELGGRVVQYYVSNQMHGDQDDSARVQWSAE
jgi:hypothetical protein